MMIFLRQTLSPINKYTLKDFNLYNQNAYHFVLFNTKLNNIVTVSKMCTYLYIPTY